MSAALWWPAHTFQHCGQGPGFLLYFTKGFSRSSMPLLSKWCLWYHLLWKLWWWHHETLVPTIADIRENSLMDSMAPLTVVSWGPGQDPLWLFSGTFTTWRRADVVSVLKMCIFGLVLIRLLFQSFPTPWKLFVTFAVHYLSSSRVSSPLLMFLCLCRGLLLGH